MIETITREKAEELNMDIWEGNDEGMKYARMKHGEDRENDLYGKVFILEK